MEKNRTSKTKKILLLRATGFYINIVFSLIGQNNCFVIFHFKHSTFNWVEKNV